jgi:arogenate dehydrogenase (NADP+), plant
LDAAMPFDYEHRAQVQLEKQGQLKIGIVGFGTFGQFLAKRMVQAGHKVSCAQAVRVGLRLWASRGRGQGSVSVYISPKACGLGGQVLATSRGNYEEQAAAIGVDFYRDSDDFCEEHPEIVLLATSILSTEAVLRSLPVTRLKRNTLFVDVLSVKEFPKSLLLALLPEQVGPAWPQCKANREQTVL